MIESYAKLGIASVLLHISVDTLGLVRRVSLMQGCTFVPKVLSPWSHSTAH